MQLDSWQARFIDSRSPRKAIVGARQCGKTTAVAAMAVYRMLARADFQVVVLSASERQAAHFVEKCKWMLRKCGIRFTGDGVNPVSIRLVEGGSRMVGLPCSKDTIRGFTANLLVIDEAAYVPDVVYAAARPMLAATGGDLVLMSTAREPAGFFWEVFRNVADTAKDPGAGDGWVREVVRPEQVPRFQAAFLAQEKKALGLAAYQQEYECVFRDRGGGVFDRSLVESALTDDVKPLFDDDG